MIGRERLIWCDQSKAEPGAVGRGGPRRNVVISEFDDGSAGAEREFNFFTSVTQFVIDLPFTDDR